MYIDKFAASFMFCTYRTSKSIYNTKCIFIYTTLHGFHRNNTKLWYLHVLIHVNLLL